MQISSKEKQMINLIAGWGRASASDISASNTEVQFDIDTSDVESTAAIMKSLHAWLGNEFNYWVERFVPFIYSWCTIVSFTSLKRYSKPICTNYIVSYL